jgi:glycerol-3-phosphate dehydrogenase
MSDPTTAQPGALRDDVEAIRRKPTAQVLVIGGGINGIATFRDLALQGVDVVLVERADYVSGASSASSHMVHGGIRYLENGEFRLVNEAVHERNGLMRIAPHYVKPLETTIPIFSTFSGILAAPLRFLTHKQRTTKERGALLIKVGLVIYDTFSRNGGEVPRHRFHGRKRSLEDMPQLNPNLKYTATYFDASMHDPERLALDVLYDGLAAGGNARAANYVEAVGIDGTGVRVRDVVSGTEFTVQADVVLNASGPWTDVTNTGLGNGTRYMGGTKGSHIVVDNDELAAATKGRELFFENDDGRIVLIYPLKGRVMIGTTDIDADPADAVVCTPEEIDYFFDLVRHVYPRIEVTREQIVYTFSGIRPLPRHDDTQPGFVSRDYRIVSDRVGDGLEVLSLVGGKWTTFRALGEHLANEALQRVGASRRVSTVSLPIGGGAGFPRTDEQRAAWISANADPLGATRVEVLLDRYGTKAESLIPWLGDDTPLEHASDYSREEIRYLAVHEEVVHLDDLVLRRTSIAFTGALTTPLVDELAGIVGDALGWSEDYRATEVDRLVALMRDAHLVDLRQESPTVAG